MYNDTFKDKIEGVKLQYVYGVNNNGDIFVSNFVNDRGNYKDYFLGNYSKRNELPKNSYNWDVNSIPTVNEFHKWIAKRMIKLESFINIKDNFEDKLYEIKDLKEFKKLLLSTLNELR